jgi:hypothetical protein
LEPDIDTSYTGPSTQRKLRMKERRAFGEETIMVHIVNLGGFIGCKPAQASTVEVSETGFLVPTTEPCKPHQPNRIRKFR